MLPEILTQKFLTRVVREYPVEGFIGNEILPFEDVASRKTMWDIITKDARLAPFIAINGEAPLAEKAGLNRMFHEIATIREKERLDEDEIASLRFPGEPDVVTDGAAATRRAVAERYVRSTADRLAARVNGRVEWMRWQVLSTGSIAYDNDKVIFDVDFGVPSDSIVTLAGNDRWSVTASADPAGDIADWIEALRLVSKRVPRRAYAGANIPKYLASNTAMRDLLKYNGVIESLISPANVLGYIGRIFDLDIRRYDVSYQDDSGDDAYLLGANKFVIIPEPRQADGEVLGDVATGPAKANNWEPGLYSWVVEETDPWETFVGAGIEAFPRIYHPNWILIANVAG